MNENEPLQREFWEEGKYPTNISDDRKQPSDDVRHEQYKEWLRSLERQTRRNIEEVK